MKFIIVDSSVVSKRGREERAQGMCSSMIKEEKKVKIIFIKLKSKRELIKKFNNSSFFKNETLRRFVKVKDYEEIRERAADLVEHCLHEVGKLKSIKEEVDKDYHLIVSALYLIEGNEAIILTSDRDFVSRFQRIKQREECDEMKRVVLECIEDAENPHDL